MSFSALRTDAGLTVEEVASQFGVSVAEVAGWESGSARAPQYVCRALDVLTRFKPTTEPGNGAGVTPGGSQSMVSMGPQSRTKQSRPDRLSESPVLSSASLIKSKKRVSDHGEVFTPPWLVEKMLNLVQGETERIDSRFLEPACGSGNFLVPILQRKLAAVEAKYGRSDFEKRHYALLALTSLYGIELLADNIAECRANMLEVFAGYLGIDESDELYRAASHVLSLNLIHGDAMKMVAADGQPIRVTEWSSVGRGKFNRRDFRLDSLTRAGELRQSSLREQASLFGGLGRHEVFTPVKDYPPMTVRELAAADGGMEADAR
ncbi:helix-turn-helix domain-containing protein [Flavisphingomonas formosensis]|uniref:helix-turn-helix domain-containing protein n=1 Tax=Flavisphingomonas formosensis TaxID=861534 RepID=UPI001E37D3DE|nr:helix-turn-helix transcriptional regulator [Sphingomonas formosensis]